MQKKIGTIACTFLLLAAYLLTFWICPVRHLTWDGYNTWTVTTKICVGMHPGDIALDEEGHVVEVTEKGQQGCKERILCTKGGIL